uniref:Cyclic nucleotide-binding domain-containing protein n=2 Tax=Lotharella globosa TaxID=91324 RepID=A0A7S3Z2P9_9EUKA
MKFVTYSERTWISKFKKKCDAFHLLHTGKIGVYVRNRTLKSSENSEKEHLLTHQTPISHFGEEMFDRSLCGASVRAETEVTCAVLERSQCEDLFREFPAIKGQIKQFIGRGIISMLQRVSFLKEIAEEKLDILRRGVHCTSYQAEHIVFYEGDVGDDFYMILKGSVMIKRKDRDTDEQVEIATLDTGSYFGEVSLIMDVARTATIVVSEPSLLLSINKKTFGTFLELNGLDMKTVMRTRIIETFKRFQIPFFQAIPDERFPQIAENCQIEKYEKGEVIFEEGEVGDRFFIISYGQVQVEKKGQVISKLGAGKYFGEVALVIEDAVRTATCSTLMQTVLLSMSAEDFKGSFELNPEALADVELKLAGQNAGMRAILHHPRALEKFETFLKTQFATESIHCWKACIEFRKAYNAEIPEASEGNEPEEEQELPKSVVDRAQHLLNRYVRVGSEDEVNIPDKVRRETIQKVDNEELAEDVFFSLEAEIVRLMRNDKLNSFRKTKDFQEILKQGNHDRYSSPLIHIYSTSCKVFLFLIWISNLVFVFY